MKIVKAVLLTIIEAIALVLVVCLAIYLIYLLGKGLNYIGIIDEPPFTKFNDSDILRIFQKN